MAKTMNDLPSEILVSIFFIVFLLSLLVVDSTKYIFLTKCVLVKDLPTCISFLKCIKSNSYSSTLSSILLTVPMFAGIHNLLTSFSNASSTFCAS